MSRSVPNSPRNQHELMKSNTLPQTAVLDAATTTAATSANITNSGGGGGGGGSVTASPGRKSRGASLTNFLKKLSPKLRQNSNSPVKQLKDHRSTTDVTVAEEAANLLATNSSPTLTDNKNNKSSQLSLRASKEEETTAKPAVASESTLTASTTTTTTVTRDCEFSSSTSHVSPLLTPQTSCGSGGSSPSKTNLTAGVCVRRTQQPPKTLNILNKIVVHPPPLEMERVKNKIASVESIGSCSLDADGTGSESSVTVDGRTSSVSQRTLRSTSGGAMSTPKASANVVETEEIISERRSIAKNSSKIYIPNGHSLVREKSESAGDATVVDGELQLKKPSYIGISCSISGYSNYSCYDSKVRREGLRSRDNSPARLAFQPINRTVDIEIDELNGGVSYTSSETHTSEATVLINGETTKTSTKTASFAMWRASSEDGILNGGHRESRKTTTTINSSTSTTKSAVSQNLISNESLNISTTPTKSLIQQRIERLYGPGALAQGFRKQAEMKNKNIDQQRHQQEKQQVTKAKTATVTSSQSLDKAKTNGTTEIKHPYV
ncbi:hypothetical protein CHUAL_003715 [Chamberlinius hualienensis]